MRLTGFRSDPSVALALATAMALSTAMLACRLTGGFLGDAAARGGELADLPPVGNSPAASPTAAVLDGATTAPAPADPSKQAAHLVAQLIAQLGSDKVEDRDAAQKQLENSNSTSLTSAILGPLTDAAKNSDDPEVRSRASAVLNKLKARQASGPSLITLDINVGTTAAVLDAIGNQAGGKLVPFGLPQDVPASRGGPQGDQPGRPAHTATIHANQKPFWEVMTDACTQLHACPALDAPSLHSMRVSPAWEDWLANSPHQIVGPYWFGIAGISRTRSLDLGTGNGSDSADDELTLHLVVYPEPKLAVTQISDFQIAQAVDDAGNSLMPRSMSGRVHQSMRNLRQSNHTIDIHLPFPQEHPGTKISVLSGQITATELGDFKQFEMSDVLGKPSITSPLPDGAVKVAVTRQGTQSGAEYHVEIDCSRQGLSDEQWNAILNSFGEVTLEDAEGHPMNPVQPVGIHMMTSIANIGSFIATGSFSVPQIAMIGPSAKETAVNPAVNAGANRAKNNDPQKLSWRFPASVKNVTLPVTFKDIPMP